MGKEGEQQGGEGGDRGGLAVFVEKHVKGTF